MARKSEKGGKFRNVDFKTWNMARKQKIMENEKVNLKSEKCTLKDMEYGEKLKITENEKFRV